MHISPRCMWKIMQNFSSYKKGFISCSCLLCNLSFVEYLDLGYVLHMHVYTAAIALVNKFYCMPAEYTVHRYISRFGRKAKRKKHSIFDALYRPAHSLVSLENLPQGCNFMCLLNANKWTNERIQYASWIH